MKPDCRGSRVLIWCLKLNQQPGSRWLSKDKYNVAASFGMKKGRPFDSCTLL